MLWLACVTRSRKNNRRNNSRHGSRGMGWRGEDRSGKAVKEWSGVEGHGEARSGEAVKDGPDAETQDE